MEAPTNVTGAPAPAAQDAAPVETVELYNEGPGTHLTSKGKFIPKMSMILPALEAKALQAYSYIKRADQIVKSVSSDVLSALQAEKVRLEGQVAELQKQLGSDGADLKVRITELEGLLKAEAEKVAEFVSAKAKDIKALQEKHDPANGQ